MVQSREENTYLTCGEIGYLSMSYKYESLAICGLQYFLRHIDDEEIKVILEKTLKLSKKRVSKIKEIMKKENHAVPVGFTESDVNLEAPRLFSDELYLDYVLNTLQIEFFNYSQAMLTAVKAPLQQFYKEVMIDTMNLEMKAKELTKKKGIYLKSPSIPPIEIISYVKKDSFLAGWLGNRRPLLGLEIEQMVYNAKRNALGHAVITGFGQVAELKEVREYFVKGREIAEKHTQVFKDKFDADDLPSAALIKTDQVTTSTVAPFSDKLMLNFITSLIGSSVGEYGMSMTMSPRHDLGAMYTRLMAEVAAYSNEGMNLLIDNAWMEQPPMAADRKELTKKSKE